MKNTQWILRSRPAGEVGEDNFTLREEDIPSISEGEFLVEVKYLSVDPSQRGWLNDVPSYVPPVAIGEVMRATGVGYVVESKHADFSAGDVVEGGVGWQTYAVCNGNEVFPVRKVNSSYPLSYSLHVLGLTGLTAYFGIHSVAQVNPGEVVVVSGAGGATGSVAGQLAKLRGARVIGIAGGAEKCRWLVDELGFSAAIDYKNESVAEGLKRLCKNDIDVFFDNVGGPILDDVLLNLKVGGRIILCGGISSGYDKADLPPGPKNYMQLVIRRAVMQGFLVLDYVDEFPSAMKEIGALLDSGDLIFRESCMDGIASCPAALKGLFRGENIGKQLVRV
jgi:NADPH-dependent curcumin reductase CurA